MIMNTTTVEVLSSLRKAAMLLVVLGEESSAVLMQQLNEEDVQKVSKEVARITAITAEQAESVLEEFHQMSTAGDYMARGGMDFARKLLTRAQQSHGCGRRVLRCDPQGRSAAAG
jgi:flagellar motor switch protein FliG